jgi:hypothetical protein
MIKNKRRNKRGKKKRNGGGWIRVEIEYDQGSKNIFF